MTKSSSATPEQHRLYKGYKRFRKGRYQEAKELYNQLGDQQDPDIMIIGCADSRADPALILRRSGTDPGPIWGRPGADPGPIWR